MTEASYETMTFYYLVVSGCVALVMAMSGKTLFETYRDKRQPKQFLLLKRRLSSAGGKPWQFSAFGREIPRKTTAPEGESTIDTYQCRSQEQWNIFSSPEPKAHKVSL